MLHDVRANVAWPSQTSCRTNTLRVNCEFSCVYIYIQGLFQIPHSVNMSKNMEDLQEELQKLVYDGPRLDEDQVKMMKVAACLLAATAVKQARNMRLRNDRRKNSVCVSGNGS